jgi:hypothetical protein
VQDLSDKAAWTIQCDPFLLFVTLPLMCLRFADQVLWTAAKVSPEYRMVTNLVPHSQTAATFTPHACQHQCIVVLVEKKSACWLQNEGISTKLAADGAYAVHP